MQIRAKLAIAILLIVGMIPAAKAQTGASIYGQAMTPYGTPASNARIWVCPYTATGTPCTPTANIYSDPNLTVPITQPYAADQYGNFTVFVTPGMYLVQVQVNQTVYYSYTISASNQGGNVVTWPTSGNLILSNGTNSPAGLAPVNGLCAVGNRGAWTTGACGSSITFQTNGTNNASQTLLNLVAKNGINLSNPSGGEVDISTLLMPLGAPATGESPLGIGSLVGAFTDGTGIVKQPLSVGDGPSTFIVPTGATQLQLGIDDDMYAHTTPNQGSYSIAVSVNGAAATNVTVAGTAMPWDPSLSGNSAYPFSLDDGTSPVVAVTGLSSGDTVTVTYVSGTVSVGPPTFPYTDANGWLTSPPGAAGHGGPTGSVLSPSSTWWPTRYMTIAYLAGIGSGSVTSVFARTGAVTAQAGDYSVSQVTGAAPTASPTFTGTVTLPVTGSTQCLHVNSLGAVSGTGSDCGSGTGSGVTSLNSLAGALSITAGPGISVAPSGSSIQITNTGSGGGTTVDVLSDQRATGASTFHAKNEYLAVTGGTAYTLLSQTGAGVVSSMDIIFNINSGNACQALTTSTLNITVNGEASPYISMPVAAFFGSGYHGCSSSAPWFQNVFFGGNSTCGVSGAICSGSATGVAVYSRLPIPFSNGITISLTMSSTGTGTLWSQVRGDTATDSWPNTEKLWVDYICPSTASVATLCGTATSASTPYYAQEQLVNYAGANPGRYVGTYLLVDNFPGSLLPHFADLEGNYRIFVDAASATWAANTAFASGTTIMDPIGNLETWSGGTTAATEPAFNSASACFTGGATTDGTGTWTATAGEPANIWRASKPYSLVCMSVSIQPAFGSLHQRK